MINASNVIKHELIGLIAEVIDAKNPSLIGSKGKIIDETRSTITLKTSQGKKIIIKNQVKMAITIMKSKTEIDGSLLVGRVEERLKK